MLTRAVLFEELIRLRRARSAIVQANVADCLVSDIRVIVRAAIGVSGQHAQTSGPGVDLLLLRAVPGQVVDGEVGRHFQSWVISSE